MYKAVVIGCSSGGLNALKCILPMLPAGFTMPVIIVQHIGAGADSYWVKALNELCKVTVKEADEKEPLKPGIVYTAPPNYHLLVERDHTLSLTIDERVNYARPSIDVLFETAAAAYGPKLIGIVLTGANHDGAKGLKRIKEGGGITIVQQPETAEAAIMPKFAIAESVPDYIIPLEKIPDLLTKLSAQ